MIPWPNGSTPPWQPFALANGKYDEICKKYFAYDIFGE